MRGIVGLAVAAGLCAAAVVTAATSDSVFDRERRALNEKLTMLARFLPAEAETDDALRKLDALIGQAGLRNPTLSRQLRPAVENEREAYVPLDLSGEGAHVEIDLLLAKLERLPRLIVLESLTLDWVSEGRVEPRLRYAAVLRLHYWPKRIALPRASYGRQDVFANVSPDEVEAFREGVDLYSAKVATVESLRAAQRNPLRILTAFDGVPVAVAQLAFDGEVHLRGARVLPAPDLRGALTGAGAEVTKLESRREGPCETFEATARMTTGGAGVSTDRTWMFEPAGRLCDANDPAAARRIPDTTRLRADDGLTFSFELVRSAGGARPTLVLSRGVMTGKGTGYRVLADRKGRYFGYSVRAEPIADRSFRLEIGALDAETRRRLAAEYGELLGEPVAIEYPEPQVVASGEPLLLDLMRNNRTGDRLSDVIRITAPPEARGLVQIVNGELRRNGKVFKRTGTAAGLPGFDLEGVGRLFVTLDPSIAPGRPTACVPASVRETPSSPFAATLTFQWDTDSYEWASRDPILPYRPGAAQVFICLARADTAR